MPGTMKEFNQTCLSRPATAVLPRHEESQASRPLTDSFFLQSGLPTVAQMTIVSF